MFDTIVVRSKFRDYEVCFVDDFMAVLKQQMNENSFLIIDQRVMTLYKDKIKSFLLPNRFLIVEATEFNKTMDYCQSIIKTLIENNIKKNAILIAVGGGIIQDITAFIASILFRGLEWYFYPTTLLAQADSCIGSKSSINIGEYKNQIGTFYPPSRIFSDGTFLETLSVPEIKSGIGEILHFLFIAGDDRVKSLSDHYEQLLNTPKLLQDYIRTSLSIKKKVIEIDEFDKKERNLFNYGHTFGHAIEALSNYSMPHGIAVTTGMDIANFISLRLGYLNENNFDFMHQILSKNMLPFHLPDSRIDAYLKFLSKDKKNIGNNLGCILTSGPGAMQKVQILLNDRLEEMISTYFKIYGDPSEKTQLLGS